MVIRKKRGHFYPLTPSLLTPLDCLLPGKLNSRYVASAGMQLTTPPFETYLQPASNF